MPVTASLKFTQGATTAPAGQALVVSLGSPVVISNGDNSGPVIEWTYTLLDAPAASALPIGLLSGGNVPTTSITPDARGGYLVELTTVGFDGRIARDRRAFLVLEASGRKIPPFLAEADALNFAGGTRGWAVIMEEWLHYLDALTPGGGGSAPSRKLVGTGSGGGGSFVAGDILCSANTTNSNERTLALTAALTDAGASGLEVLLENGVAGETKLVATIGMTVTPAILGIAADTQDSSVVIDTVTGRATRTNTPDTTQWLIGRCDKKGNTTLVPRRSNELHVPYTPALAREIKCDGYSFISAKPGEIDFGSFKFGGAYPDPTGVTNIYTHLKEALKLIGRFKEFTTLFIPPGLWNLDNGREAPLGLFDDAYTGFQQGCTIKGYCPTPYAFFGCTRLQISVTNKKTTAANYVSRSPGAAPQNQWRASVGALGLDDRELGRYTIIKNSANNSCKNGGIWHTSAIWDVGGGNQEISVGSAYFNTIGVGASDIVDGTGDTNMVAEFLTYGLALHARTATVEGIVFVSAGTNRLMSFLSIQNPAGPGGAVIVLPTVRRCTFAGGNTPACIPFYGLTIAHPWVPVPRSQTFTVPDPSNDTCLLAEWQILTGTPVKVFSTTTLPAPLVAGTTYFARFTSVMGVKLYPTLADANANTNVINITTSGTGTHTIKAYHSMLIETAKDGTSTTVPQVIYQATNGNGNCDVGVIEECAFFQNSGWQACVSHGSASGQSIEFKSIRNVFQYGLNSWIMGRRYGAAAHASFYQCSFALSDGFGIEQYGGDRTGLLVGCYHEAWGGILRSVGTPWLLLGTSCRSGTPNAFGAEISHDGTYPISIQGGLWGTYDTAPNSYGLGSKNSYCPLIYLEGDAGLTGKRPAQASIQGVAVLGDPLLRTLGAPARMRSGISRGVWQFVGTEEFWAEEAGDNWTLQTGGTPLVGAALKKALKFDGTTWTDVTTALNSATAADVTLGTAVGSRLVLFYDQRFCALSFNYAGGTAGIGGVGQWRFSNASAGFTAFSSPVDNTTNFTVAPADGLEVTWRMPSNANAANAWKTTSVSTVTGGAIVDTTQYYAVDFNVTTLYTGAPVLDRAFVDRRKRFTFTAQDIADACNCATKYNVTTTTSLNPILGGSQAAVVFPSVFGGATTLDEVWLSHVCRAINFQAAMYEWNIAAMSLDDQLVLVLTSGRPGMWSQGHYGSLSRMKAHAFTRTGKIDISATPYLNCAGFLGFGHNAWQAEVDSKGLVEVSNLGGQINELDCELTINANRVRDINLLDQVPMDSFAGRVYGMGANAFNQGPIQYKKFECQITSTGVLTVTTPGWSNLATSLGAVMAKTVDLLGAQWFLTPNARFIHATLTVDTGFSGGGAAVVTVTAGKAGDANFFAAGPIDIMTTGEKDLGAFTGRPGRRIFAVDTAGTPQIFLASDANLNGLTAGKFTLEIAYQVRKS